MNKKLRLLVTTRCPNKCPMCCNNQFDFSKLPVVDRWDYDEIMITGGEPMLHIYRIAEFIGAVRYISELESGKIPKIYIYTSYCYCDVIGVFNNSLKVRNVDGVVITPHTPKDIEEFIYTNQFLLDFPKYLNNKPSLRLNLFPDMKALLPKDINLSLWQVKDMEWVENCPVPEGEDFRRIANLW